MIAEIDLNADLGESFGNWRSGDDEALLGVVSSANIACGFHAGDPSTVHVTTRRAAERGVAIGAHVSYPDLAGFGRRFIDMSRHELTDATLYQLGALAGFARVAGTRMTYVKPHGALYNALLHHETQAAAVVDAVRAFDDELVVLHLPNSELRAQAEHAGLRVVREVFADRMYAPDGSLAPRHEPGAVLHDAVVIGDRVRRMVVEGEVVTTDGSVIRLAPESVCVHGDTPEAARIAAEVRQALQVAGARITPFAPAP